MRLLAGRWIDRWEPEDPVFWELTDRGWTDYGRLSSAREKLAAEENVPAALEHASGRARASGTKPWERCRQPRADS